MMRVRRRAFLETAVLGAGAAALGCGTQPAGANRATPPDALPAAIRALTPMTAGVVPIADDERRARIANAQKLMREQKLDAVFMEGTASMSYFANMRWGQSERTFAS
jgi:Xaa-Pro dipeptidase